MKKLNIKLEDLRQQNLKDLFKILEVVFSEFEVEFYILGAMAVNGITLDQAERWIQLIQEGIEK